MEIQIQDAYDGRKWTTIAESLDELIAWLNEWDDTSVFRVVETNKKSHAEKDPQTI